jgi:hypothetical protein
MIAVLERAKTVRAQDRSATAIGNLAKWQRSICYTVTDVSKKPAASIKKCMRIKVLRWPLKISVFYLPKRLYYLQYFSVSKIYVSCAKLLRLILLSDDETAILHRISYLLESVFQELQCVGNAKGTGVVYSHARNVCNTCWSLRMAFNVAQVLHSNERTQVWMVVTCDVITELVHESPSDGNVVGSEDFWSDVSSALDEFKMEAQHLTIH